MKKQRFFVSTVSTVIINLIAHAYAYFSYGFSHDSLQSLYRTDTAFQIGLGRFLQPLYSVLQGRICAPWLCGVASIFWLILVVALLTDLFEIKSHLMITLLAAFINTAPMLGYANATYIYTSDIYALAFFLNVFAVWLTIRSKYGFLPGMICIAGSLALYQSYISAACGIMLMLFAMDAAQNKKSISQLCRFVVKCCVMLLGAGLLYKLLMEWCVKQAGIVLSDGYNGLASLGDYAGESLKELLLGAYQYVFESLRLFVPLHIAMNRVAMQLLLVLGIAAVIALLITSRTPWFRWLLTAAAIVLLPLALNITYIISKAMVHDLMTQQFIFIPVFCIVLLETVLQNGRFSIRVSNVSMLAAGLLAGVLVASSIQFSNLLYLRKQLEYQSTISTMNRVILSMENAGYSYGKHKVAIVGSLNDSAYAVKRPGLNKMDGTGAWERNSFSTTYYDTYDDFMTYIMGYPVMMESEETMNELAQTETVKNMPCFPAAGYCKIIDDTMVVKLSE